MARLRGQSSGKRKAWDGNARLCRDLGCYLVFVKSRNRDLLAYIAYLAAVTAFIALTAIAYYRSAIPADRSLPASLVESFLTNAVAAILYFFVIRIACQCLEITMSVLTLRGASPPMELRRQAPWSFPVPHRGFSTR